MTGRTFDAPATAAASTSAETDAVRAAIKRSTADLPMFQARLKSTTTLSRDDFGFIYWRYSTNRQEEKSAERQIIDCKAYAQKTRIDAAEIFGDRGISGTVMASRPGLQKMLAAARARRPKYIIVEDLDRLSRRLADLLQIYTELSMLGIELHDIVHGRLDLVHVMIRGYMGEEGRVRFLSMARSGKRKAVERGVLMHKVSYGYRLHPERKGVHIKDDETAKIVIEIFSKIASGMTANAVARDLTRRGIAPPAQARRERKGGKVARLKAWCSTAITKLVRSYIYLGFVTWGMSKPVRDPATGAVIGRERTEEGTEVIIELAELAIVDRDLWSRANLRLNEINYGAFYSGRRYLLTGKAFCGVCGSPLSAYGTENRIFYLCTQRLRFGHQDCAAKSYHRIDWLERTVLEAVFGSLIGDAELKRYEAKLKEALPQIVKDDEARRSKLLHRLEATQDIITRSYADEAAGILSPQRGSKLRRDQGREADLIEIELGKLRRVSDYLVGIDALTTLQKDFERMLADVPFRPEDPAGIAQAQALRDAIAKIVVHQPDAAGITRIEIWVDPLLQLREHAPAAVDASFGVVRLDARFEAKKLRAAERAARSAITDSALEAAARDGRHDASDAEWAIVEPFFADAAYLVGGQPAPRLLMNGMLCMARERAALHRLPARFGEKHEFRRAVMRIIYSRQWDAACDALMEAGASCVRNLEVFDSSAYPRRNEGAGIRPDAEQAKADRLSLLEAIKGLSEGDLVRLRCETVARVLGGATISAAAYSVGVTLSSAYHYWSNYLDGGVDRLLPSPIQLTRQQRISDQQVAELKAIAEKGVDPDHPDRPMTTVVLCRLVASMFGVQYTVPGLKILCRRHGFDLGTYHVRARREGRLPVSINLRGRLKRTSLVAPTGLGSLPASRRAWRQRRTDEEGSAKHQP